MMNLRTNYAHRIAKEYAGILPYHEVFYLRSIKFAAGRAISAFDRFLERIKCRTTQTDSEEIIFTLQEALGHCAAVSRFFWPVSEDKLAVARGKNLRAAFALGEGDPLSGVRLIRNRVEHFDERLDRFCSRDPAGNIFDLVVSDHILVDQQVTHVLRLVDAEAKIIVLFGTRFSYAGLEESISRILAQSQGMDRDGGRLRAKGCDSTGV
jgi:hypothetical protein